MGVRLVLALLFQEITRKNNDVYKHFSGFLKIKSKEPQPKNKTLDCILFVSGGADSAVDVSSELYPFHKDVSAVISTL